MERLPTTFSSHNETKGPPQAHNAEKEQLRDIAATLMVLTSLIGSECQDKNHVSY
jgi:hypothetical protein